MQKFIIYFFLIFTACFLMLPVTAEGQSSGTEDYNFTPEDCYFLGRAVAANILSAYKPITQNHEAIQYLNKICQTLVINSGHPMPYKGYFLIILDSNEFNAFATPGGHIFITKKLLELTTSEDMLAAVIAHELTHIMLEHGIKIINETKTEDELSDIANWAAGVAAQHSTGAARAADIRNSISKTVDILMKNGYSHTQEYEADLEAVVLLAKAGYDPQAFIELLKILQKMEGNQISGLYSTHPGPAQRIKNLESLRFNNNQTRRFREKRFLDSKF